jgi:hypothetical protein
MSANKSVTATFNISSYTLTVTKSGAGTGTVSSSPSGIYCGSTCSYQFSSGTNVTLTAAPDSSSSFGGWSGDATGTGTTTTITMSSNKSVTAIFNIYEAGFFAGGVTGGDSNGNFYFGDFIDKLLFYNESLTTLATTLSRKVGDPSACNSSLSGYFAGGFNGSIYTNSNVLDSGTYSGTFYNFIDKLSFSNESRVTLSDVLSQTIVQQSACNSTLVGYFTGGLNVDSNQNKNYHNFIDKLSFSSDLRSTISTTLYMNITAQSACNSSTAGYFGAGYDGSYHNFIDKLLFSNESRSLLGASISDYVAVQSSCNSIVSGYFAAGYAGNGYFCNFIDRIYFANETRTTLTATISIAVWYQSACNSSLSSFFAGGYNDNYGSTYNFIDKLLFSSESRSTLSTTLSRTVDAQAACQSGGIV